MSKGLLKSRETKNSLFKAKLTDPSDLAKNRYKNYANLYFKTVRAAKKQYYSNKLKENVKNPAKTWETLSEIMGRKKKSETIEKININGLPVSDPQKIATEFNSFFSRVGTEISNSVPPVDKKPEDYINYGREIPNLNLTNTTPEHVIKTIGKLKPKNSCDVQGMSTKLVKFIGREISVPLAHIFNLSLSNGEFPTKLKQCRVIPIFKSGSQLDCDNYRPISLLSSISKVLEKIVA